MKNALKDQTNQVLQETNENFRREFKTAFTKQVKKSWRLTIKRRNQKLLGLLSITSRKFGRRILLLGKWSLFRFFNSRLVISSLKQSKKFDSK